ncbi:hypothetical protein ECJB195_3631, partial [Escherichia coli JB1-95]
MIYTRRQKYSQRDIELARQLHQRGVPRREIAEKFGMKLRAVNNYVYFDRRFRREGEN